MTLTVSDITDPTTTTTSASNLDLNAFLRRYVPETKLVEDVGLEVTYQLPNGPQHTAAFERLFRALDENLSRVGVSSYGISDTTLEEVGGGIFAVTFLISSIVFLLL